jgi:hypothetical protein
MRNFGTGATRDSADWKLDLKGFLSARAVELLGRYMHFHRHQADGKLRDSDNWKLGIPIKVYEESETRHVFEWLRALEDEKAENSPVANVNGKALVAALGMMFNLQGWLHEQSKLAERLGIDLASLIELHATAVKAKDAAEADRVKPKRPDYKALERSIQRTTDDEWQRKNRVAGSFLGSPKFDPAEDYHGPIPPTGPQWASHQHLVAGEPVAPRMPLAGAYKSGSAYHGIMPNPNPAPADFGQHSDWTGADHGHGAVPFEAGHYHKPTAPGETNPVPTPEDTGDDRFHPDTFGADPSLLRPFDLPRGGPLGY